MVSLTGVCTFGAGTYCVLARTARTARLEPAVHEVPCAHGASYAQSARSSSAGASANMGFSPAICRPMDATLSHWSGCR